MSDTTEMPFVLELDPKLGWEVHVPQCVAGELFEEYFAEAAADAADAEAEEEEAKKAKPPTEPTDADTPEPDEYPATDTEVAGDPRYTLSPEEAAAELCASLDGGNGYTGKKREDEPDEEDAGALEAERDYRTGRFRLFKQTLFEEAAALHADVVADYGDGIRQFQMFGVGLILRLEEDEVTFVLSLDNES